MRHFMQRIEFTSNLIKPPRITFFEGILADLDKTMKTPTLYGWFHLLCLVVVVILCALIFLNAKKLQGKTFDWILGITSAALIILEVYKQLNYSYNPSDDTWKYQWYAFPFQFCSTPMYVMFVASFLKKGKVKNGVCAFLATYGLFAGAAVMFYPGDVFVKTIGINIQTMVHHGMMVVIGVLTYATGKAKLSHKTILSALPVFCVLVGLAIVGNELYHRFGDLEQTFNLFYISPHYDCTLPVLSAIYPNVPYFVFLLIYLFGFTAAGYVVSLIAIAVNAVTKKIRANAFQKSKS